MTLPADYQVQTIVFGVPISLEASHLHEGLELSITLVDGQPEGAVTEAEEELSQIKISGQVLEFLPPEEDKPGAILLLVAGKEVLVPVAGDLEGLDEITVGSYVELKGTTETIAEVAVSDEDEETKSELKGAVVGVTPGTDEEPASVTLNVGGQEVSFTAEELGLPAEALAVLTAGAEFKLEGTGDETELKISGPQGEVKVEIKDGKMEVKIEAADEDEDEHEHGAEKAAEKEHKAREKAAEEAHKALERAAKKARKAAEKALRHHDDEDDDRDDDHHRHADEDDD